MRCSFPFMVRLTLTFIQKASLSMFSTMIINKITPKLFKANETREYLFQDCLSLVQRLSNIMGSNYGKSVHCWCIKTGFSSDVFVQNNMMKFYSGNGDLSSARQVFDEIPEPNLVSWTTMISSHVHGGRYVTGLRVFHLMLRSGLCPNEFGFSLALKACRITRELVTGLVIHGLVLKSGFEFDMFCSSAILGIYLDFGKGYDAFKFLDAVPLGDRSAASWNALIDSFVQRSKIGKAFKLYQIMRVSGVSPNCYTHSIMLKLCSDMLVPLHGMSIHGQIVKLGFEDDVVVGSALVDAYAKLGLIDEACRVFWSLKEKDNVVWCALLSGLLQSGQASRGLNLYSVFLSEGCRPDVFTFSMAFGLCSTLKTGFIGAQIHCTLIKYGFVLDNVLGNSLINMYGNLGMVSDAYECFREIRSKEEMCFDAIFNILISTSNDKTALDLFSEMRRLGFISSQSIVSYVLRALRNLDMLKQGKTFHSDILKNQGEFESSLSTENALIEMYGKCGDIYSAENVFRGMKVRDEYSWTALMTGFGQIGKFEEVLRLFRDMLLFSQLEKPSRFTIVALLQACMKSKALSEGKQAHGYIIKTGFSSHPFIESSLIGMYSSSKIEIQNASKVFSLMEEHDLVSWSIMLTSWVHNGYYEEALAHFSKFHSSLDFLFDETIFSTCLSACAGLAATETGKSFHGSAIKTALDSNLHVASSIIDMYSKCGYINEARWLFDKTKHHNLVTWTSMISGYAYNGLGKEAIKLFGDMKETGLRPDGVTFIGVLSACSHAGLVGEGLNFFESMKSDYEIEVGLNHYACMIDMLGRNVQVNAAESLIEGSALSLDSKYFLWRTLLGACNTHMNIEVGNRIARKMLELRPNEPSTYVLLSNIYASASMWDKSTEVRSAMREANVTKRPGSSWIQ